MDHTLPDGTVAASGSGALILIEAGVEGEHQLFADEPVAHVTYFLQSATAAFRLGGESMVALNGGLAISAERTPSRVAIVEPEDLPVPSFFLDTEIVGTSGPRLAAGDFDDDGDDELAVLDGQREGRLWLVDHPFTTPRLSDDDAIPFPPVSDVDVGDIDGDGVDDIVVLTEGSGSRANVIVFLGPVDSPTQLEDADHSFLVEGVVLDGFDSVVEIGGLDRPTGELVIGVPNTELDVGEVIWLTDLL